VPKWYSGDFTMSSKIHSCSTFSAPLKEGLQAERRLAPEIAMSCRMQSFSINLE
jgi:hypothetical protein